MSSIQPHLCLLLGSIPHYSGLYFVKLNNLLWLTSSVKDLIHSYTNGLDDTNSTYIQDTDVVGARI